MTEEILEKKAEEKREGVAVEVRWLGEGCVSLSQCVQLPTDDLSGWVDCEGDMVTVEGLDQMVVVRLSPGGSVRIVKV